MLLRLRNVLVIQGAWYACTYGVASGKALLGPMVVALVFLLYTYKSPTLKTQALFVATVSVLGTCLDLLHIALGTYVLNLTNLLKFEQIITVAVLFALWANFAMGIPRSLRFLQKSPWLAASFGLFGAPLVYRAGQRFGAITLLHEWSALAIGVSWAIAIPLSIALYKSLNT